jgi:ligand-binding sensor domain-containing protein/two-component sensor histidine kinase
VQPKWVYLLLLLFLIQPARAQRGLAFIRFSTEDGIGLSSNVVYSMYQGSKGFMWVGTANGLQRFDGRKFIQFSTAGPESEPMPYTMAAQIMPVDSGKLLVSFPLQHEFGIFNPRSFKYKKTNLRNQLPITARAEFKLWRDNQGQLLLNISGRELLMYHQQQNAFLPYTVYNVPKGWRINLNGFFDDAKKNQVWLACDSGLVIYDRASRQTWSRHNNPHNLPIFKQPKLQDHITEVYIDRKRRIWLFSWPSWAGVSRRQYKFCLDSTGSRFLHQDTLGLNLPIEGYTEYHGIFEPKEGGMWVYGLGVLLNYDMASGRFLLHRNTDVASSLSVDYNAVHQIMQDKDGALWIATDRGLYFTGYDDDSFATTNVIFARQREQTSFTDLLQMPNGDYWLSSWGSGIHSLSKELMTVPNHVYKQKPEDQLPKNIAAEAYLPWTLCLEPRSTKVWIGCNKGILIIHDTVKKTTRYLQPEACNKSTIRFIGADAKNRLWLGTQAGRLVKWEKGRFTVVQDIGTIIYKIFFDKSGIIWLATHEKGLYAIDPESSRILQHYTSEKGKGKLFSNTGTDIEQLNDSTIVYGAGALNFINKKTGAVRIIEYGKGLPSNTVKRLRMDNTGFLWIITSNGLCRYNPRNDRITTYGRSDGILLAEQTGATDYFDVQGRLLFAGQNALIMFNPASYSNSKPPADVTITDFRLFNQFLPADSLAQLPEIRLDHNQNTFAIHFASLSYMQRNKLAYYYKMNGIDKGWNLADGSDVVNFQLLPPGWYTFQVYCETIEGIRSKNITTLEFYIRPPYWHTKWFWSCIVFLAGLFTYFIHNLRVNRLLAVEKLRNRVARDLHDDMGSTLSTINILSSMAKTKMHTDTVKTSEYLSKIGDNSQRMMEAMDDIVWSIKPTNDSMQRIAARMREFATSVLEAKDIGINFLVQEEVFYVKLNMEARRDFFLLFKEAVNNAAKYSKATAVSVKLELRHRTLMLTVQDDGEGFDVATADSGNGLGNMHKRADSMNGKVRIQSAPQIGTTVIVTIPLLQNLKP